MSQAFKHTSFFILALWLVLLGKATKAYAQAENDGKIIVNDKLTWDDFTGQLDETSKYWARTNWRVTYKYKIISTRKDTVAIELNVLPFLKTTSWVLPSKKTDELLVHEQGHFNFALLVAAEFKKTVNSTILLKSDYNQKISFIFNSVLNNVKQMEVQYDEETKHMVNKKEQLRWNIKIDEMLKNTH